MRHWLPPLRRVVLRVATLIGIGVVSVAVGIIAIPLHVQPPLVNQRREMALEVGLQLLLLFVLGVGLIRDDGEDGLVHNVV